MSVWRVYRADETQPTGELFDVTVVDTLNPFGNHAIAHFDDFAGAKFDDFRRGTKVEFEVNTDGNSTTFPFTFPMSFEESDLNPRFTGYVVEPKENDRQGTDTLSVECYSYDQFLRRETVTNDQSGKSIENALKDIVETDTPVLWNASNVTVENEETLTISLKGERVENAIQFLRSKSANEEFGVTDDLEFFFRPQEANAAPRNINNTQWIDYDIPEKGKETINEVTVYYGPSGNRDAVTVNDGADQQELEQNLGTAGPVVLKEEVTFEDITDEGDAKDKALEILNGRETTITGTVTTFGLFDASPGDIINIQIDERGISGDFRIAALEYRWGPEETVVTIVENQGDQDELLVRMSDTLKRVEMREADRSVEPTRFVEPGVSTVEYQVTTTLTTRTFGTDRFDVGLGRDAVGLGRDAVGIDVESVTQAAADQSRVTNSLRDATRNAWKGDAPPAIDTLAVGDGTTAPSRTDTALANQVESTAPAVTAGGTDGATFAALFTFITPTTLAEAGLLDGSTLHERHTVAETTAAAGAPVDVVVTIQPVNAGGAGLLTTTGRTAVTNIVADNSPDTPATFVWGDTDTAPVASNTALNNETFSEAIDSFETPATGTVAALHRLAGGELASSDIAEFGVETLAGTLLTHTTFAEFTKASNQEVEGKAAVEWVNA